MATNDGTHYCGTTNKQWNKLTLNIKIPLAMSISGTGTHITNTQEKEGRKAAEMNSSKQI